MGALVYNVPMPWYIIVGLVLSIVLGAVVLLVIYIFIASGENESEKQWEDHEPPSS
jgi:uncharacterized membrane protein